MDDEMSNEDDELATSDDNNSLTSSARSDDDDLSTSCSDDDSSESSFGAPIQHQQQLPPPFPQHITLPTQPPQGSLLPIRNILSNRGGYCTMTPHLPIPPPGHEKNPNSTISGLPCKTCGHGGSTLLASSEYYYTSCTCGPNKKSNTRRNLDTFGLPCSPSLPLSATLGTHRYPVIAGVGVGLVGDEDNRYVVRFE